MQPDAYNKSELQRKLTENATINLHKFIQIVSITNVAGVNFST